MAVIAFLFFLIFSSFILSVIIVEHWDITKEQERYDKIPEIWQGHNVADFIDPEIMEV
jgi:hypothetical protein